MPHGEVSGRQRSAAKKLRRDLTDAERKLWYLLRSRRFEGVTFRRQVPVGPYIVDFAAHRLRLIVEVDGGQHLLPKNLMKDRVRDEWLRGRGYKVLRFSNEDVLTNLDAVVRALVTALPELDA
jgi:very-short-patch-repair endonuclease